MKVLLSLAAVVLLMFGFSGCSKDQENLLVGTWEFSYEDRLPGELPRRQWRFTADYQLIRLDLPENNQVFQGPNVGRWELTKRNRVTIREFDNSTNGEWQIILLNNRFLKMVLKAERDGKPAGQTLYEFTKRSN